MGMSHEKADEHFVAAGGIAVNRRERRCFGAVMRILPPNIIRAFGIESNISSLLP